MLRRAAFASRVVASMPIVLPLDQIGGRQHLQDPGEDRAVRLHIDSGVVVREIVECSGVTSSRPRPSKPRSCE